MPPPLHTISTTTTTAGQADRHPPLGPEIIGNPTPTLTLRLISTIVGVRKKRLKK
jgi:hypothetical protein